MINGLIPNCNREERRKIQRYMKKHPNLSYTEAYNKLHGTKYVDVVRGDDAMLRPVGDLTTKEVLKYWSKLAEKNEDNKSADFNQIDYYNEEDPESPFGVE